MEDQLAGRTSVVKEGQPFETAIDVFIQDKKNQGLTEKVIGKYTRELARLRQYCEKQGVFTVQSITRELLTGYAATWEKCYPASLTRSKVRERLREEYATLLDTCYATFAEDKEKRDRVHALVQLVRWSGLAIRNALTIERSEIAHEEKRNCTAW